MGHNIMDDWKKKQLLQSMVTNIPLAVLEGARYIAGTVVKAGSIIIYLRTKRSRFLFLRHYSRRSRFDVSQCSQSSRCRTDHRCCKGRYPRDAQEDYWWFQIPEAEGNLTLENFTVYKDLARWVTTIYYTIDGVIGLALGKTHKCAWVCNYVVRGEYETG